MHFPLLHTTLFFSILLSSTASLGFENKTESASFEAAEKAKSFLRFQIPTKKMGLFKSQVTGYAKKFKATGTIEGKKLRAARIEFPVRELDTDLYARNDQMWNACLGNKENPLITVTFSDLEFTEGKSTNIRGTILLRGQEKPLSGELTLSKKDGRWVATGKAASSFEELSIPDPSIGVASVDGPITIEFSLEDKE